jgi:hypothetical protein
MAGEFEAAGIAIHLEDSDVVAALITTIEELTGGIEVEAAWIVPARPFLPDIGQSTSGADRKDRDAVVQTVTRIEEPAIGRNHYLRAEITTGKSRRQRRDRLTCSQPTRSGIVVKQNYCRTFFLNGVEPASIWVEEEMPRPVSRR